MVKRLPQFDDYGFFLSSVLAGLFKTVFEIIDKKEGYTIVTHKVKIDYNIINTGILSKTIN